MGNVYHDRDRLDFLLPGREAFPDHPDLVHRYSVIALGHPQVEVDHVDQILSRHLRSVVIRIGLFPLDHVDDLLPQLQNLTVLHRHRTIPRKGSHLPSQRVQRKRKAKRNDDL